MKELANGLDQAW